MRVDELVLEDFRNYERASVAFGPGINLVVGRNAQGKTNLLEAVYCLSGFGSPRSPDTALVRDGADRALLHALVNRRERRLTVDLELKPGRGTRALVNKTPAPMRELVALTTSVFFGPDELSLVKGSPDGRRRFLDELAVKLRPARAGLRREWERVLKQRNALLKSAPRHRSPSSLQTLEVWDESLCLLGARVAASRLEALAGLLPYARKRYEAIAGGGHLELEYVSSWMTPGFAAQAMGDPSVIGKSVLKDMLASAIESVREREVERGISLTGPQRDDIGVSLQTSETPAFLDVRAFASQGDQRTSALALKLAEHDLLMDSLDERPILLLDDVFSELDPQRRSWLADAVRGAGQVLVSSAEPGTLEATRAERVLRVGAGRVERDG